MGKVNLLWLELHTAHRTEEDTVFGRRSQSKKAVNKCIKCCFFYVNSHSEE